METKHLNAEDQELATCMLLNLLEVRREAKAKHDPNSWVKEGTLENWGKSSRHAAVTFHAELERLIDANNDAYTGAANPQAQVKPVERALILSNARVLVFNAMQDLTRALVMLGYTVEGKTLDRPPVSGRNALARAGIALAIEDRADGRSGELQPTDRADVTPLGKEVLQACFKRGAIGDVKGATFQDHDHLSFPQQHQFREQFKVDTREKKAVEIAPVAVGTHAGEKRSADAVETRVPVTDPIQPGDGSKGAAPEGLSVSPVPGSANVCNGGTPGQDSNAVLVTGPIPAGFVHIPSEQVVRGVLPAPTGSH